MLERFKARSGGSVTVLDNMLVMGFFVSSPCSLAYILLPFSPPGCESSLCWAWGVRGEERRSYLAGGKWID